MPASSRIFLPEMNSNDHLMGVNHERLTFRFQGRDFRLTDIKGTVVRPLLA